MEDLLKKLSQDEEFVERQKEEDQKRQIQVLQLRLLEEPILRDIEKASANPVTSLAALQNVPLSVAVVDVLLTWLGQIEQEEIQAAIVRSLTASGVEFDGAILVELFENSSSDSLRWAIANTIAEARPVGITDSLLRVVPDSSYGDARQMLLLALARLVPATCANKVLWDVFDELPGHAADALAESGDSHALEELRKRRNSYKGWVRNRIDRAIRFITRKLKPKTLTLGDSIN